MKKLDMISEKLEKAKAKLEEIKEKYNSNSEKIKTLIQEKAGLLADEIIESSPERKKKILDIDKRLDSLKKNVESSGPELISALEKRIGGIQAEKTAEDLRLSFEKQKKIGQKICALSTDLIKNLELANNTNIALREAWKNYHQLSTLTKKSTFKKDDITSQGSAQNGMLEQLTAILKWEIKSRKPRMCIEVGRIRY